MNSKGSGLMLIVILVVALLIGYLAMTQMDSLGFGKTDVQTQTQQNAIEQAQNAVDAINNRIQQTDLKP
jgi:Tfp pilus assembly protein PilX